MATLIVALACGLFLLVWSANWFVEGASGTSRHLGMPPLVIGMVVVGFGTSAPEMVVSAMSARQGAPGIALGNAYGSNIANIGLILGLAAVLRPIVVHSRVLRKELPLLAGLTALAAWQIHDDELTRPEAIVLLTVFGALMAWTLRQGFRSKSDALGLEVAEELASHPVSLRRALVMLVFGLVLLIASSRLLVWGAIGIATDLGVSELVIGLTIVAIGTSLPELAATIIASRKGEDDLALGNVLGSNLFNTLAVVGIVGAIEPMTVEPAVFSRDIVVMATFTTCLFLFGYGMRGMGRINRVEGAMLLGGYVAYAAYVIFTTSTGAPPQIQGYDFRRPSQSFSLEPELREVSGVTMRDGDTVVCVQDEDGILFEFDLRDARVRARHAVAERGDFEDVVRVGKEFWMMKSSGALLRVVPRGDSFVVAEMIQLDAGYDNYEGLGYDERRERLLVAPKDVRKGEEDVRRVFAFDLSTRTLLPEPILSLSAKRIVAVAGTGLKLHFSAVAVPPQRDEIWLLSAVDRLLVAVSHDGEVIGLHRFGAELPKGEGMTFLPDGDVVLSSEGPREGDRAVLLRFDYQPDARK
jgi:cation:H+ antiporter